MPNGISRLKKHWLLGHALLPLELGDFVSVQDQTGNTPRRWSKTGTVIEILGHDAYLIQIDGSLRVTKRNRQFLSRLVPYKCNVDEFTTDILPPMNLSQPHLDAPDPIEESSLCPSSLSLIHI